MLSIAMLVLTIGLMFIYTLLHPDRQPIEEGKKLARRIRIGVLGVIMALGVTVGYLLPVEVGQGFTRLSERQSEQQIARAELRMDAERRHVARMIEVFGGTERYLSYLNSEKAQKTPL